MKCLLVDQLGSIARQCRRVHPAQATCPESGSWVPILVLPCLWLERPNSAWAIQRPLSTRGDTAGNSNVPTDLDMGRKLHVHAANVTKEGAYMYASEWGCQCGKACFTDDISFLKSFLICKRSFYPLKNAFLSSTYTTMKLNGHFGGTIGRPSS